MQVFPNVSLVVMHSNMNINMDSKQTCAQANKQQKQTNKPSLNMYAWAFKKRTQTI